MIVVIPTELLAFEDLLSLLKRWEIFVICKFKIYLFWNWKCFEAIDAFVIFNDGRFFHYTRRTNWE